MSDSRAHLETMMKELVVTADSVGVAADAGIASCAQCDNDINMVAMDNNITFVYVERAVKLGHAFE